MVQPRDEEIAPTLVAGSIAVIIIVATFPFFTMGVERVLGFAKTSFHYSKKPLILRTKQGLNIELPELCKAVIPPCRLNPFLFNGHLQTMWTVLKKEGVPIYYKRRIFENEDPTYTGTFAVDFVTTPYKEEDSSLPPRTTHFSGAEFENLPSLDSKPMLVVLHGLSGGSHELYLRHVIALLVNKQKGWEACVVNARGCAKSTITSSVLYNARATWDVRQTVKWLREKFPNRPLFGVGFSLGANILTNVRMVVTNRTMRCKEEPNISQYIGEEGADCKFQAAVVLSNPWNLDAGSLALQRTFLGLHVYSRAMGTSMKALFESHIEHIQENSKINVEEVRKVKYLHEFDREVQGPTWGYPTEGAYYRDASSVDSVLAVRIPLLAVHAEDDPIADNEAIPRNEFKQTPYGVLCTTTMGGHLSWFELGGGRWFAKAACAFLDRMHTDIDVGMPWKVDPNFEGLVAIEDRMPLKPVFDPVRRKLHIPLPS